MAESSTATTPGELVLAANLKTPTEPNPSSSPVLAKLPLELRLVIDSFMAESSTTTRSRELVLAENLHTPIEPNPAPSPFLTKLPPELRLIIYSFVYDEGMSCRCSLKHDTVLKADDTALKTDDSLLRTCRQIRAEVPASVAFASLNICESRHHISKLLLLPSNGEVFYNIKHLHLEIEAHKRTQDPFVLIGSYGYCWNCAHTAWGQMLTRLAEDQLCLESLTIHFKGSREPEHDNESLPAALRALRSCRRVILSRGFARLRYVDDYLCHRKTDVVLEVEEDTTVREISPREIFDDDKIDTARALFDSDKFDLTFRNNDYRPPWYVILAEGKEFLSG